MITLSSACYLIQSNKCLFSESCEKPFLPSIENKFSSTYNFDCCVLLSHVIDSRHHKIVLDRNSMAYRGTEWFLFDNNVLDGFDQIFKHDCNIFPVETKPKLPLLDFNLHDNNQNEVIDLIRIRDNFEAIKLLLPDMLKYRFCNFDIQSPSCLNDLLPMNTYSDLIKRIDLMLQQENRYVTKGTDLFGEIQQLNILTVNSCRYLATITNLITSANYRELIHWFNLKSHISDVLQYSCPKFDDEFQNVKSGLSRMKDQPSWPNSDNLSVDVIQMNFHSFTTTANMIKWADSINFSSFRKMKYLIGVMNPLISLLSTLHSQEDPDSMNVLITDNIKELKSCPDFLNNPQSILENSDLMFKFLSQPHIIQAGLKPSTTAVKDHKILQNFIWKLVHIVTIIEDWSEISASSIADVITRKDLVSWISSSSLSLNKRLEILKKLSEILHKVVNVFVNQVVEFDLDAPVFYGVQVPGYLPIINDEQSFSKFKLTFVIIFASLALLFICGGWFAYFFGSATGNLKSENFKESSRNPDLIKEQLQLMHLKKLLEEEEERNTI